MKNTLFGPVLDTHDIAEKLLAQHFKESYISVKTEVTELGASLEFFQCGRPISLDSRKGVYVIYRKNENKLECLYVGYTEDSIYKRIYRWMKELAGKSRPDENHPGAAVAKSLGVNVEDTFYIRVIDWFKIWSVFRENDCYMPDNMNLDEHIAEILRSWCNVKRRTEYTAQICQ